MPALLVLVSVSLLAGCDHPPFAAGGTHELQPAANPYGSTRPRRVISVDYCADQYALKLLAPEQILALSPDATADFSFLRARAAGIPKVRPRAEDILSLAPDLILRSYGGGPNASQFFRRAGVQVIDIPPVNTLDQSLAALRGTAEALGVAALGRQKRTRSPRGLQRSSKRALQARAGRWQRCT